MKQIVDLVYYVGVCRKHSIEISRFINKLIMLFYRFEFLQYSFRIGTLLQLKYGSILVFGSRFFLIPIRIKRKPYSKGGYNG